jgi:hypothetical protein
MRTGRPFTRNALTANSELLAENQVNPSQIHHHRLSLFFRSESKLDSRQADQANLPVVSSTMHPGVTNDKDKGRMVTSVKAMMSAQAGKNSEAEATI